MKKWLIEEFLPMWAKETVLSDNRQLRQKNEQLQQKVHQLEAYIRGLESGMRGNKRIQIYNRGGEA